MKILVISNLYPPHGVGGYEQNCRTMSDQLAARGHEIRVLTSNHREPNKPEISDPHVFRDLRIHGFFGHPWLHIHQLYHLEVHNHRILLHHLKTFNPDVVYVWNMGGISKSLLHRLQDSQFPTVFYVSDHWMATSLPHDVWLKWWNSETSAVNTTARTLIALSGGRKLLDHLAPTYPVSRMRFPHISFTSKFLRDLTASKGRPVGHAEIIHCFIDTSTFTVKTDHSRFSKILWVGRLVQDKDPITAIRAIATARSCGLTHLSLDLYGHGDADYLARLDAEIERLQLTHCVRRQYVRSAEIHHIYHQYDALLLTSNWGEPFALTPLEAMASGVPIITTTDGGQQELARHGENCLIATAADHESFANRIAELSSSPQLRSRLAAESLAEVRSRFDVHNGTLQLESLLLDATTRKKN
jgi:glycosyltransferase involved in cell wall biosynthesis